MYNRRRSARRKLWEIAAYKDSEQHISEPDDEEENKTKAKCRKKSFTQYEKCTLKDWASCGSGFHCKEEFERDKVFDDISKAIEEEALIETASYSEDDNLHSTQISEISHNSNKSVCSCTDECSDKMQDIHEDSSECNTPTSISSEHLQIGFPSSNEQVHNVSYAISPPSSPIDSANSNLKGSDWLLKIPWQPKSQKEFYPHTEFDSGKKKKKFISGGFAAQLHKLQSREKSAKAFWDHYNHDSKSPLSGKESMILELTEATCSYGTVICRASTVKTHHQNELFMDSDTNLIAKDINEDEICEKYIVLLDYDQYEKLSISAGSVIQLFPPWKVLHIANVTEPVLLCTYFLRVLKKDQLFLASYGKRNYQKEDGEIT